MCNESASLRPRRRSNAESQAVREGAAVVDCGRGEGGTIAGTLVLIELLYASWKARSSTFPLPNSRLVKLGASREVKRRVLRDLEQAGLISVERPTRKSPVVTLSRSSCLRTTHGLCLRATHKLSTGATYGPVSSLLSFFSFYVLEIVSRNGPNMEERNRHPHLPGHGACSSSRLADVQSEIRRLEAEEEELRAYLRLVSDCGRRCGKLFHRRGSWACSECHRRACPRWPGALVDGTCGTSTFVAVNWCVGIWSAPLMVDSFRRRF